MNSLPYTSKEHVPVGLAALYSRSDLPWTVRLKIKQHLRHCEECAGQVERFRAATTQLKLEAEANTLTGFEAIAEIAHRAPASSGAEELWRLEMAADLGRRFVE